MRKYLDAYGSVVKEYWFGEPLGFPFGSSVDTLFIAYENQHKYFNRNKKKATNYVGYIGVYMSFDIETTRVGDYSAPYIFTTCLCLPPDSDGDHAFYIYHCKSWEEVNALFTAIKRTYHTGWRYKEKGVHNLLCFVHNLSFEFYFARHELPFDFSSYSFFAKDKNGCNKVELDGGIEFRDTQELTHSTLQQLAKMYTLHQKVKDLDYTKQRNTLTPLTDEELRYINDDVIILTEFMDVYFDKFCNWGDPLPITNTQRLYGKVKNNAKRMHYKRSKILRMQPTAEEVLFEQQFLMRGGFVHGNIMYNGEVSRVYMRDITSSYPWAMLTQYYPMSAFEPVTLDKVAWHSDDIPSQLRDLLATKCVKMRIAYYDLKAKTEHSYESIRKCIKYMPYEGDPTKGLDNGRIRECEYVELAQTELDFEIYNNLYTYSLAKVIEIKVADRGPLPEFLLECLRDDYKKKNLLKCAGLMSTTEYILAKIDINTYFGMCCKSLYVTSSEYDGDEWNLIERDKEALQKELDERYTNYDWGVWIAAHSRLKLVKMVCAVEAAGGHVVYYDTDSIKYIPSGDGTTERLFVEENERIREANKIVLDDEAFFGKNGKGLGEWDSEANDFEGKPLLVSFKSLGSKRYLYFAPDGEWTWEDGEWIKKGAGWHLCVAGLSKIAVKHLPKDPFDFFSRYGFSFNCEESGKLMPKYIDHPYSVTITDDYGNTETIHCKSGITLVPVKFDISENTLYSIFMAQAAAKQDRRGFV